QGGNTPATLLAIAVGAMVYLLVLLLLGGLGAQDVEMIPYLGPRLSARLRGQGLLKD
ncbi:MAG: hypothetical protein GX349_01310, partial [Firmicutes bacterium]|nr:hypothetical protein [Bacillota bacterium]